MWFRNNLSRLGLKLWIKDVDSKTLIGKGCRDAWGNKYPERGERGDFSAIDHCPDDMILYKKEHISLSRWYDLVQERVCSFLNLIPPVI